MKCSKKDRRKNPETVLRSLNSVRCANLLSLVGAGKRFASQNELAATLKLSGASYLSQMVGPNPRRRFTEVIARRFEYLLELDTGWLDVER